METNHNHTTEADLYLQKYYLQSLQSLQNI